jgi:hypothetical protein
VGLFFSPVTTRGSGGIGLEINAEKTKFMIMSRHLNSGQNQNIRTANESFEKVAKFKRLKEEPSSTRDAMFLFIMHIHLMQSVLLLMKREVKVKIIESISVLALTHVCLCAVRCAGPTQCMYIYLEPVCQSSTQLTLD